MHHYDIISYFPGFDKAPRMTQTLLYSDSHRVNSTVHILRFISTRTLECDSKSRKGSLLLGMT